MFLFLLDLLVAIVTLLCGVSIYKIRTIIAVYKGCSTEIQKSLDLCKERQIDNPFDTDSEKQAIFKLLKEIKQAEFEKASIIAISLLKLPLDIIAFAGLVFILILNHRYIVGHKLYELHHNQKAEFGLGLFSTEELFRKKISKTDPQYKSEDIFEPHRMIVNQAIYGVVDLLFIIPFLCQIISPWRMGMTITTCSRFLKEIRGLSYSADYIDENETQVYNLMGLIRKECYENLFMSILDVFGIAIIIVSPAAVWRIYYQIFIIKTVISNPHKEIAQLLCVKESHHRLNMLVAAEFKLLGVIFFDLLCLPFALVDAVAFWNYGKLHYWLKQSKHDDFREHRAIIFHIFVETLSQVLRLLCWIVGIATLLRIRTFLRFVKIIVALKKNDDGEEDDYKKARERAVKGNLHFQGLP